MTTNLHVPETTIKSGLRHRRELGEEGGIRFGAGGKTGCEENEKFERNDKKKRNDQNDNKGDLPRGYFVCFYFSDIEVRNQELTKTLEERRILLLSRHTQRQFSDIVERSLARYSGNRGGVSDIGRERRAVGRRGASETRTQNPVGGSCRHVKNGTTRVPKAAATESFLLVTIFLFLLFIVRLYVRSAA